MAPVGDEQRPVDRLRQGIGRDRIHFVHQRAVLIQADHVVDADCLRNAEELADSDPAFDPLLRRQLIAVGQDQDRVLI